MITDENMILNRDIGYFFNPKSIAVIGASNNTGKVGYTVLNNIIESGYQGNIYPINPKNPSILGIKAYESILDITEEVDVAIFVIPGKFVTSVAEECV